MFAGGLSNIYLNNLLKPRTTLYAGTFSCNNIVKPRTAKYVFIANLSPVGAVGTHFVCVAIDGEHAFYYDPLGLPCYNKHILEYMSENCVKVRFYLRAIQTLDSIFCGYHCAAYVFAFENNVNVSTFLSMYTPKPSKRNDQISVSFVINEINKLSI